MGAALCTVAMPIAAHAGSTPTPPPFSLTVSPARLLLAPWTVAGDRVLTVSNTGRAPLHVTVLKRAFFQAPDGRLEFSDASPFSAVSQVSATPDAFDLDPGDRQPVRVTVAMPADPEPGEHQVAIIFLMPAASTDRNVAINRGIGTQLLIRVPGPVIEKAALGPLKAPRLVDGGPARLTLTVRNRGNVHRDYIGPARLMADAGGARVPFPDFTVLRGSTRVVSTQWRPPLACVCRVRVVTDDGQGHRLVATATVVVFPFRLTIGFVGLVLGLALLSRSLRRRSRGTVEARVAAARQEAYEQAHRELAAAGSSGSQPSMPDRS